MTASRLALKTERKIRVFCPTAYLTMDFQKKSGIAVKLDANLDLIRMARERNCDDLSQMQDLDYGSMLEIEPVDRGQPPLHHRHPPGQAGLGERAHCQRFCSPGGGTQPARTSRRRSRGLPVARKRS